MYILKCSTSQRAEKSHKNLQTLSLPTLMKIEEKRKFYTLDKITIIYINVNR